MASPVGPPTVVHSIQAGTSALASQSWRRYLKDIFWATRLTVSLVILLAGRAWPSFRHQLACLIVLTILVWPVRSVRWGTLYNLFVLGFFFTFPIVGLQYFIEKILWGGHSLVLGSVLVAPLTEEIGKILPLVLLLAIGRLGFRNSYGACDLMLCGAALGAGFGLFESSARLTTSLPTPSSPGLLGIAIFPDSYNGFIGHSGSTALIGLSLDACSTQCVGVAGCCQALRATFRILMDDDRSWGLELRNFWIGAQLVFSHPLDLGTGSPRRTLS